MRLRRVELFVLAWLFFGLSVYSQRMVGSAKDGSRFYEDDGDVFGIFYRLDPDGHYTTQLVSVSMESGGASVIGNIGEGYFPSITPGVLVASSETYYWPYLNHNGRETLFYVATLAKGYSDSFYYEGVTVNLEYDTKNNLLYALIADSEGKNVNFSIVSPQQKQIHMIFPINGFPVNVAGFGSAFNPNTGSFFVVNGTVVGTISISKQTASYAQLGAACVGTVAIFYDQKLDVLFGLQIANKAVSVVKLTPNGVCSQISNSIVSLPANPLIYDAAYNQQTSSIAFIIPTDFNNNGYSVLYNINSGKIQQKFQLASCSNYNALKFLN